MKTRKRISTRTALAATTGLDTSELDDYRYQAGRQSRAVYCVDDFYFCAGKTKPTFLPGINWEPLGDQFWAQQAGTVIWKGTVSF
jgi:hypothetical protein